MYVFTKQRFATTYRFFLWYERIKSRTYEFLFLIHWYFIILSVNLLIGCFYAHPKISRFWKFRRRLLNLLFCCTTKLKSIKKYFFEIAIAQAKSIKKRSYIYHCGQFYNNVIMIWLTKSFVVCCDNFHTKDFYVAIKVETMMMATNTNEANKKRIRNLYDLFGWWHWIENECAP